MDRVILEKKLSLSEKKRLAILDAAKSVFMAQGFAATSMDNIAAHAGVSKRTVYNHFASKEDLFAHIVQELIDWFTQSLGQAYSPDKEIGEQLYSLLMTKLEMLQNDYFVRLSRLVLSEVLRAPEDMALAVEQSQQSEDQIEVWLKDAVEDQKLEIDDIGFAANQLISLLKGASFYPQVLKGQATPTPDETRRIAQKTQAIFLAMYGKTS